MVDGLTVSVPRCSVSGIVTGTPLAPAEKRLRTLNKVLRDIEELQRREAAGEELDEAQLTKMERMDDVLEEMEELMAEGSANS